MPLHDWTRVEAGIFHAFHTTWIAGIQNSLNAGLLPEGYYALAEQHAGKYIADVLTLHLGSDGEPAFPAPPTAAGGTAVAEAPPQTRVRQSIPFTTLALRRTLAIRHVSTHRVVALIEILSPGNKDRPDHVAEFVEKTLSALERNVHVLMVDVLPPGPHDPRGMHSELLAGLNPAETPYTPPADEPLTFVSYVAGSSVEVFLEQAAVQAPVPLMPLFLDRERYVNVPLEATYMEAYRGMPSFWRNVLDG